VVSAQRDFIAYTLANIISVWNLLDVVLEHGRGTAWTERAAESLLLGVQEFLTALEAAKSREEFYTIHHEMLGRAVAALMGWHYLFCKGP